MLELQSCSCLSACVPAFFVPVGIVYLLSSVTVCLLRLALAELCSQYTDKEKIAWKVKPFTWSVKQLSSPDTGSFTAVMGSFKSLAYINCIWFFSTQESMDLQQNHFLYHLPIFSLLGKYNYHTSKHTQGWSLEHFFTVRRTGWKQGEELTATASIPDPLSTEMWVDYFYTWAWFCSLFSLPFEEGWRNTAVSKWIIKKTRQVTLENIYL